MIVKGGQVFVDATFVAADLRLGDGVVQEVAPDLAVQDGEEVVDATGCLVTPGLVDFHVHAFKHGHHISLDIDAVAPGTGVTTFVDCGSVGAIQIPSFRHFVADRTDLNLFAYINISLVGQTTSGIKGLDFHDNDLRELIHLPLAEEMIEKHRDFVRGIKVRVYTGMKDLYALEQARILADRVALPILVHLGPAPPVAADTLKLLRPGDMITHPYHGGADTILGEDGRIRPEFIEARARGIEVDLGMDRFHCDLTVMRKAFDQGFFPDYVSTDLTLTNVGSITFDLPTTISKCVACGLSLEETLVRATTAPAAKIGAAGLSATLSPGEPADVAIFRWDASDDPLVDFFGNAIHDAKRLRNVRTILRGRSLQAKPSDVALWDSTERAVPWANYA